MQKIEQLVIQIFICNNYINNTFKSMSYLNSKTTINKSDFAITVSVYNWNFVFVDGVGWSSYSIAIQKAR